jgi:Uma2 family endonuclease
MGLDQSAVFVEPAKTMSTVTLPPRKKIYYPDSDGLPMAENTVQFNWIVLIKTNLEAIFAHRPDVFVAGDLFWYPVEGDPTIRAAPDVLTAFGRPKGDRGSYKQWEEGGIAPQVAWEILSPSNRGAAMVAKFQFYQDRGVEEYYTYDPDTNELAGWLRQGDRLEPIKEMNGWVSPRLQIRFAKAGDELTLHAPDGQPFRTFQELVDQAEQAQRQVEEQAKLIQQLQEQLKAQSESPKP